MDLDQLRQLEAVAKAGAVVVLKMDGQRVSEGDAKFYTLMISGGELGPDDFFRLDGQSLSDLIHEGLRYYTSRRSK
jgi:hypothetical protein